MTRITKAVITRGTVTVVSRLFIGAVGVSVFVVALLLLVEISLAVVGIALCKLEFCWYKHAHHVVYLWKLWSHLKRFLRLYLI